MNTNPTPAELATHLTGPVVVIWDTIDAKTATGYPNVATAISAIEHEAWQCADEDTPPEEQWDVEWMHDDCGNPMASYNGGLWEATITTLLADPITPVIA